MINVSLLVIDTSLDSGRTNVGFSSLSRNASCIESHTIYEHGMVCVWSFWDGLLYRHVSFWTFYDIPKNSCNVTVPFM
jgi:hypothetical protein